MDTSNIYLASTNPLKVSAVLPVVKEGYGVHPVPLVDDPLRPNQPVGYVSARFCAQRRINTVIKQLDFLSNKAKAIIVAIENYIDHGKNEWLEDEWWDAPLVVVANGTGEILATSPPTARMSIGIERKYVEEAKAESDISEHGWSTTVGQIINRHNPQIPADNWHKHFGGFDRQAYMEQEVKSVFQLVRLKYGLSGKFTYYPDFPKPGVLFKDMNPLLADDSSFRQLIELMSRWVPCSTTHIVGLESRGFILGAALALETRLPFVPIRKPGKLPGTVISIPYEKEYGTDSLEMQVDLLPTGSYVVIVDDVLATGGTARAAVRIVRECKATVTHFIAVTSVPELLPTAQEKLADVPFTVLL